MATIGTAEKLITGRNVQLHISSSPATSSSSTANDYLSEGVAFTFKREFPRVRTLSNTTTHFSHENDIVTLTGTIFLSTDVVQYIYDKQEPSLRGVLPTYVFAIEGLPNDNSTGKRIKVLAQIEQIELNKDATNQAGLLSYTISLLVPDRNVVIEEV